MQNLNPFTQLLRRDTYTLNWAVSMGWNNDRTNQPIAVESSVFTLKGVAEKSGFKILVCFPSSNDSIPEYSIRRKIEAKVTKLFQEHLIIFVDAKQQEQIWLLVVRQTGRPTKATETRYHISQDPELLFQRASGIFFELDEEERITIIDVTQRVTENFYLNNERVTKQFYERFSNEHASFVKFIKGIEDKVSKEWYASLMLNRLMFCYFIQKKGFLDNNKNYLWDKLKSSQRRRGNDKFYSFYRSFLLALFHQGLGAPDHSNELKEEIGRVPYLNGGLFEEHELENVNPSIDIGDKAFERIFEFFDQYEWHLDTRHTASGRDINPDVIGYIFEKYINYRADMGAYYTKEDITDYISRNCVLPYLFDETKRNYPKAFAPDSEIWQMVKTSGDDYIFDPVKHGLQHLLPKDILKGIKNVEERSEWNNPAPTEFALPTEIWREVVERRSRYEGVRVKIEKGEIQSITDFIRYNLNISQFAQDVVESTNDAEFLKEFYKALSSITIIDPTCGSGAFLFAALNILEPLYESCIMRMRAFVDDEDRRNKQNKTAFSHKHKFFRGVLENIQNPQHPNLKYFIYKSIILRNLYGVDIMKEAVEIAKLRLFLKLVATVEADYSQENLGLEPLPDIDFNIRAGNTLIGFATHNELKKGGGYALDFDKSIPVIEEKCEVVAKTFKVYKEIQLSYGDNYKQFRRAKDELNSRIKELNHELNKLLHKQTPAIKYDKWLDSYQPFHWFAEYYEIIQDKGGFDAVIGNPPYVEYSNSRAAYSLSGYETSKCCNLYAFVIERSYKLLRNDGVMGMIIPISAFSNASMVSLQKFFRKFPLIFLSNFHQRPAALFEGVLQRLSIFVSFKSDMKRGFYSSKVFRWKSETRHLLFPSIFYTQGGQTDQGNSLKIGQAIEAGIVEKFYKQKPISNLLSNQTKSSNNIYYRTAGGGYWVTILNTPFETNSLSNKKASFQSEYDAKLISAVLNSNLFWWYYSINFDQFNFKDYMIFGFRFNYPTDKNMVKSLIKLSEKLEKELLKNATSYTINSRTRGSNETITYNKHYSKETMDKIDAVLAQHYGFTDEELDFIVNYDIKYRLGLGGEDDDE